MNVLTSKNQITYSIIIPHKDIPDLLQRCLDSIPQRDDVQVIVVDDNSDPGKVDFVHFPGLDREDVKCYFTKEGKGAGYARNIGLQHARGKWLLFADADDFFHEEMLAMLDKWKDSERDIIYFETNSVDSNTLDPVPDRLLLHPSEISKEEMENNCSWIVPWGKMIRTRLVHNYRILFEELHWSNDVMFSFYCSYHAARNVDICNCLLYCATDRKESLVNEILSEEHLMCRMSVMLRFERFINRYHMIDHSHMPNGISISFYYLSLLREVGEKEYRRGKIYYLRHASFITLIRNFVAIVRFKIRHKFSCKVL